MKKLLKFIKYNKLILGPMAMFLFLLIMGIVHQVMLLIVVSIAFIIVLVVALIVTLKRYE